MKLPRFSKLEVAMLVLGAILVSFLLFGCGSRREQVSHEERSDKKTIKTTTTSEKTVATPQGPQVVESIKTVIFTEEVAKGVTDSQLAGATTLEAPEAKAVIGAAANLVAPGLGGALGGALGWLTGTPQGATTGLCLTTLLAALTKRAVGTEKELTKTKRHFKAVVKGNSDFMQANPDMVAKFKEAQRSAQVDPELKAGVIAARVEQGQV